MKSNINNVSDSNETIQEENENIETEKSLNKCSICGQQFRFLKALIKHEERHKGDGGFVCRTCGMHFTSAEAREKHRDKDHKVLRCKICSIRFEKETEYLAHINKLHDGRDRELSICSECGKQFKTKGELTHHVKSKCGTIKKYQCKVCFQTLMTAGSLHNHMLRHSGERAFMCRFCAKTFLTAGQLTVHERIHTQEKAFICEVCKKGFCHRQSLITHSTLHTGIKPYQCESCGNSFSCVGNLLKHRKTHADTCGRIPLTSHRVKNPSTKLKVQVNTPPTIKLKTLEKRKKILVTQEQSSDSWQQNSSQESTSGCSNKSDAILSAEPQILEKLEETNILKQKLSSNLPLEVNLSIKEDHWITPLNFISNNNHNQQTETIDSDLNNILNIENMDEQKNNVEINNEASEQQSEFEDDWTNNDNIEETNSESSDDSTDLYTRKLKINQKTKQQTKKNVRRKSSISVEELAEFTKRRGFRPEKGLDCQYCGNHYSVAVWLIKHERKHEASMKNGKTNNFKCCCCNLIFETKDECSVHQQNEHVDELKCKECDKFFSNADSLKAHINVYHKGVPRKKYLYICDKCGKIFKQKAVLATHKESNCVDGPLFKCTICEKRFTSKHVLKSHMRVHMPEKMLLCKFCGKSFHWKGQLKIHERSHTGERPFKCQLCPKAFAYRESLITHTTLHTGIKPHLCQNCGSRFSCIGNLLKHRRTHANTCGMITQIKIELL